MLTTLAITLLLTGGLAQTAASEPNGTAVSNPMIPRNEREKELLKNHREQSARNLDLFTVNLFHRRLGGICARLPLRVVYGGPLARARGTPSADFLHLQETPDAYLVWHVIKGTEPGEFGFVVFTISVSLQKESGSAFLYELNDKKLYIEITFPRHGRALDDTIILERGDSDKVKTSLRELFEERLGAVRLKSRTAGKKCVK